MDGRLGDARGAPTAVGLDDIDLASVLAIVGPQPDPGEQALMGLGERALVSRDP